MTLPLEVQKDKAAIQIHTFPKDPESFVPLVHQSRTPIGRSKNLLQLPDRVNPQSTRRILRPSYNPYSGAYFVSR